MEFLEDCFKKPNTSIIVGEDALGLFCFLRWDKGHRDKSIEILRNDPQVKWWRDFHNQRKENLCRGAREAAADFFRELRQRNLDLPPGMSYLRKEI